jgi:hypothetical protein
MRHKMYPYNKPFLTFLNRQLKAPALTFKKAQEHGSLYCSTPRKIKMTFVVRFATGQGKQNKHLFHKEGPSNICIKKAFMTYGLAPLKSQER